MTYLNAAADIAQLILLVFATLAYTQSRKKQ